jgi:hypothetical protein
MPGWQEKTKLVEFWQMGANRDFQHNHIYDRQLDK